MNTESLLSLYLPRLGAARHAGPAEYRSAEVEGMCEAPASTPALAALARSGNKSSGSLNE